MLVEINNIALTYPDIFLADNLAIHGVLAPFVSAKEEDGELALNFSESLECESKAHKLASVAHESHDNVDWGTVIHSLSSSGFIPSWSTHLLKPGLSSWHLTLVFADHQGGCPDPTSQSAASPRPSRPSPTFQIQQRRAYATPWLPQIRRRRIHVPSGVPSSRDVFGSDSGDSTSSSDVTSNLSVPPPPVQHQVPEERQRRRRHSDQIPAIGESAFKTHAPSSGRETQNPRPSGVLGSGGFKSQRIPALRVAQQSDLPPFKVPFSGEAIGVVGSHQGRR
ncbi:hypothetical protein MLD38_017851 [Melastoma candidum]|uniref:Uncharacterized protein n=2 Tax=Melastoma candidum TaxID=119954 RepID=A0ACB9QSI5_9MYRT|nr:hypothetical protein MLD38_017850 [Melastoma candidum]KAI4369411.1 hypothetical protein MLD38_017851 [Melastoma candidum]